MLIRCSEHVGKSYVNGCILELEEMGATVERQDQLMFSVTVLRRRHYQYVIEFLRQAERIGALRFDATEE